MGSNPATPTKYRRGYVLCGIFVIEPISFKALPLAFPPQGGALPSYIHGIRENVAHNLWDGKTVWSMIYFYWSEQGREHSCPCF